MAIHCPHCGSPVMIRCSRWECDYCGDFGSISSLHPSEKAKLIQAATPTVQVTITVTGPSDEPTESDKENSPRSFSVPSRRTWCAGGIFSKMSGMPGSAHCRLS